MYIYASTLEAAAHTVFIGLATGLQSAPPLPTEEKGGWVLEVA